MQAQSPSAARVVPLAVACALAVFAFGLGGLAWLAAADRDILVAMGPSWSRGAQFACAALLAAFPAVLAGWAVDRQVRLREALRREHEEVGAARAELLRSNKALLALGAVNHELIHAVDREAFLAGVCQALLSKADFDLVWVGMAEPGAAKRVRVVARAGEDAGLLESLDIRYDAGATGQGPAGSAIREGRMVYMPHLDDEAFLRHWPNRPRFFPHFASGIAFPLWVGGRVAGALAIYARREREFSAEEVALLSQMADDVAHGLHVLRVTAARNRAATLLRQALRVSSAMAATARAFVAGKLDMPGMAALVASRAMELTGSALGAVGLVEARTGRVDWLVALGKDGPLPVAAGEDRDFFAAAGGRFAGPLAQVLNDGEALRHNAPSSLDDIGLTLPKEGLVERFLAVPLRRGAGGAGGLLVLADAGVAYRDRDVRAVQRLAMLLDMGAVRLAVEQELDVARRRAEAANQSKTQFLANISHELRTPINGILGMAQLAILEGATGRDGEYWQTVRESVDRLVEIVDNLLDLASVESGSLSPMLREFSLRRLLESLRGAYAVRAGLAGLTLDLALDPVLPDKLLGDPFRLRQILAHLLDNAIRFTPAGSISLRADTLDAREAGEAKLVFVAKDFTGVCVRFAVADTGIGIPKEKQHAIFESFTLAEECLTKRFGGTGMGLAIANRLAELLGGTIRVESQPGFGSTFTLSVPLWPVAVQTADAATPPPADALPPLRFLVAEDEAVNRLALARSLRKLGHTVIEAGNGEEALRQLALGRVDVVIMDIQMPVMDGLTAVAHIRNGEIPETDRHLPVVALTAYALEGDRKRFLAAGMDEFVTKPCDMDQLLRAVAKVLSIRRTGQPHHSEGV